MNRVSRPPPPTRADSEHEAAVAHMIDGARHVREELRVPVRVAGDERADRGVARVDGGSGSPVALVRTATSSFVALSFTYSMMYSPGSSPKA